MKKEIRWYGADVKAKQKATAIRALNDSLEYIMGESNKIIPHDEGTLQRSGQIDVDKSELKGTVSYDTPYARRMHEHPEYRFQKGREGKFLEKVIFRDKQKIAKYMADKMKSAFK